MARRLRSFRDMYFVRQTIDYIHLVYLYHMKYGTFLLSTDSKEKYHSTSHIDFNPISCLFIKTDSVSVKKNIRSLGNEIIGLTYLKHNCMQE